MKPETPTIEPHSFGMSRWFSPALTLDAPFDREAPRLSPFWQIAIALMINLLSLALPIMSVQIYDRIIPNTAYTTLSLLIAGVLTALCLEGFLRLARSYLVGWLAATHEYAASRAAIGRLARVDLPSFARLGISTHMQNFSAINRLREYYGGQTLSALVDLPFIVIFLGLLAYLGGILTVVPATLLLVFLGFAIYAGRRLRRALEGRAVADESKFDFIISVLSGIHTIKALGTEATIRGRFEGLQAVGTEHSYRVALASGFATCVSAAFSQLSTILTVTAGSLLVLQGEMSVGGLSACTMLAGRCLQPVQRVLGTWLRLQDFALSHQHAHTLLSLPVQIRATAPLPAAKGHVSLNNVSFSYGDGRPILKDVTLDIRSGEAVAILAEKGSGKSVLLQLMAGLLAPTSGTVLIDGINPTEYGLGALHQHIGYLPQQGMIYKGSVQENLCGFEDTEAVLRNVKIHCQRLGLDSVIDQLAKGQNTLLNDSWADPIPPGVKQRIALVRAMRHQPAIVLFDDADQALDKEGYNRLFSFVGRMKGRCTLVIVSQDANLLSMTNRSLVLEDGMLRAGTTSAGQALSLMSKMKGRGQ